MIAATHPSFRSPREAGFTLPELLLASVLGAMLLTALAVNTFGFTQNLDHLEEVAGVSGADVDPVLRIITRDIREAWWVENVGTNHLKLADTTGALTEYYVENAQLKVKRPNGDIGVMYENFQSITMDTATADRYREGDPASFDAVWYSTDDTGAAASTLVATSNQQIAIGFIAPAVPSDIPSQASVDEQLLSVQASVFTLPIAWKNGSGTNKLALSLYESWAPGLARPTSAPLATALLNGGSMPTAHKTDGVWDVPASTVPVSLSSVLEPGVGYTLVLAPQGSNTLVVKQRILGALPQDQVMHKASSGASWVQQSALVPFSISGPWQQTTTLVEQVITRVTITVIPKNRPLQQRSAVVLSQSLSDDPWLGVVPGQSAP